MVSDDDSVSLYVRLIVVLILVLVEDGRGHTEIPIEIFVGTFFS